MFRTVLSVPSVPSVASAGLKIALELKTVFEQTEIRDERRGTNGLHLGDERRQLTRLLRGSKLFHELIDGRRARRARHARGGRHFRQSRARPGCRWKAADG